MKKYIFRLLLIAFFVHILLDINNAPEYNYTTTIKSTITETEIDIPKTLSKFYNISKVWGNNLTELGKDILREFGFE